MNDRNIGMLVRVDACLGCQACQVACREENGFPYSELWLEMIRRKPQTVSGELRNYHVAAPQLDKCTACAAKDHQPLCTTVCPTKCLFVGEKNTLLRVMEGAGHWNLHV
ncbi:MULTISPECIES: 4Fe-4S dicluster domain-containing protein [Gordonibacter]|uniref:hypothetical protein n=1 Tax=Gordonibacter TaxID=644652 RepID=UPI00262EC231|nr:hypothetical protein [Gordonibacter sp. RACS_AR68]MDN4470950.1 hypothetical protein [Gordonibacter sp. RACS_AR68]